VTPRPDWIERRRVLGLFGPGLLGLLAGCGKDASPADSGPVVAADDGDTVAAACPVTAEDMEGPYYRADIQERADITAPGEDGEALLLTGIVTDADCAPIAGALVEIWQADAGGSYDTNSDQAHYYGSQRTAADGSYAFQTHRPGRYLNGATYRPEHIHVKVWVDGVERLITQIYFDGDPYNESDAWYDPERSIVLSSDGAGGLVGIFDVSLVDGG